MSERDRAPLVLCYLQGLTRDETARRLGCSESTLHRRLDQARDRLRRRLERRGMALSAGLLTAGVGVAAVSPSLAAATAGAARLVAAGNQGAVPARVASLVTAGLRALTAARRKAVGAVLLAATLAAATTGLLAYQGPGAQYGKPAPQAAPAGVPARAADEEKKEQLVSGRVLDPDGKPVAGAKVHLLRWNAPGQLTPDKAPPKVWAETDKDGRFSFTAPPHEGELFVTAVGFAPGWDTAGGLRSVVRLGEPARPVADKLEVRLTRDDVPVSGRLLDVQGESVAGATIRVFSLQAPTDGSLNKWIEAVKKRSLGERVSDEQYFSSFFVDGLAHFFPPVTTDKDGRFRIPGVGRERIVALTVEGPAIETRVIHVVTRPGVGVGDLRVPEDMIFFGGGTIKEARLKPYYPQTFTHTADPGRVITGVVRDKASGKPIAGAVVRSEQPVRYPAYYNRTTADKDGRYRLTGMPLSQQGSFAPMVGPGNGVVALPPDNEPYLAMRRQLPAGKEAVATFDFDLPRGAWLEGQVKDKATGRGVAASLNYFLLDSPRDRGGITLPRPVRPAGGQDGRGGQVPNARRPGARSARCVGGGGECGALPNRRRRRQDRGGDQDRTGAVTFPIPAGPLGSSLSADQFDALVEVKPEKGATRARSELELDPGRTVTVQVRGPDGKALAGARTYGQSARVLPFDGWSQRPLPAEFPVYGLAPEKGRTVLVVHPEKNLAARCEIKGDENGPIALTLQPAATVAGRLVDDEGQPRKDLAVDVRFHLGADRILHLGSYKTDAAGKFRIDGMIPALSYDGTFVPRPDQPYAYSIFNDLTLKSGESKDVGDVKAKKGDE
jgi:hypothetical protein